MNQKPKHTETSLDSYDAVAYGCDYMYDGFGGSAWASQSAAWSRTLTEHRSLWITDGSGNACTERSRSVNQHLQYLPFGEQFIDQRTNHDIRYKFTTKEEDSETGYQYFGARYYASDLSIWLSVDPLVDKYPHLSPYNYCEGNPVMLIDPNGMNTIRGDAEIFEENFNQELNNYMPSQDNNDGGKKTITIDPGHGDHHNKNSQVDPGAVNGKDYEKDIALNISNAVTKKLEEEGYIVTQTRNGDVEDAGEKLEWRLKKANGTDIFISIHTNANKNESANGFEVCYKTGDDNSKKLAQMILGQNTLFKSRGVKPRSNLRVLNGFNGVSVLVEVGFISNSSDLQILKTKSNEIGQQIATGIINYLNQ